jgi:hypothetical protein
MEIGWHLGPPDRVLRMRGRFQPFEARQASYQKNATFAP